MGIGIFPSLEIERKKLLQFGHCSRGGGSNPNPNCSRYFKRNQTVFFGKVPHRCPSYFLIFWDKGGRGGGGRPIYDCG